MGSVALEGENKGNILIMKVLAECKQFQVESVVTRNPTDGQLGVQRLVFLTALKYHPKYTSFMRQGIICVSPAKGTTGIIPLNYSS